MRTRGSSSFQNQIKAKDAARKRAASYSVLKIKAVLIQFFRIAYKNACPL